ncbi:transcriptional regulator [Streptomyces davaonensis JCM 4913]|uniref:Transcriptional regulator n=1 Tax=Streptomyces davaonensis (strain DSM 101723 / JCM 4913 / KCC S-0913 / 768) TaxID=1214101 RepID=K4R298_STRDJ|nr:helix-turn-helix transcriptional regulator [Streptomyces davaonensis]CCK30376.1 transcriptional regulator [Streptomyces davaonensis JCM 4913]
MSTDYQQAREALGRRLRDLRLSAAGGRLTGTQLAQRLGWPHSKVYKLEGGRQTANPEDLQAWADAVGHPDTGEELLARLGGFESHIRSWRRQLAAGHRPVQDVWNLEVDRSEEIYAWEESVVPGMLQTADYARAIFQRYADLYGSKRDTEEAVRMRILRQQWLHQGGHTFHALVWEAALHSLICAPAVLAAQLDRLAGMIGMDTVDLGIVPLGASLKIPAANGFWVLDDRLVIAEDWHAEIWLDDTDSVATYMRVWHTLRESAVYGLDAQALITRAQRTVHPRA